MANLDKLVEHARPYLEPGEEPAAVIQGTYEAKVLGSDSVRKGILIATDRRVVFYAKKLGGYDLESFPYRNISSVEQGKNMMGAWVTLFAHGNRVHMKWVQPDGLVAFMQTVRTRSSAAEAPAPAPHVEAVTDQLHKLGELRDAGILSEDEFAAKKAELLARM